MSHEGYGPLSGCCTNGCRWVPPTRWQKFKRFVSKVLHPIRTYRQWRTFRQFRRVVIPMIRRVYPTLIANDIVSIQPMTKPAGDIFNITYRYQPAKPIDFIDISYVNQPYDPDKEKK